MIDKSTFDLMASVIKPATAEYVEAYNANAVPGGRTLTEDHIGKRQYFYMVEFRKGPSINLEVRMVWEQDLDEVLAALSETHEFGGYVGTGQYDNKMPRFIEKPKPVTEEPVTE